MIGISEGNAMNGNSFDTPLLLRYCSGKQTGKIDTGHGGREVAQVGNLRTGQLGQLSRERRLKLA
jgi:hypothetical protein